MWSFVYYILEIKKSYISSHVHVYKSRLIFFFLSSVFKFSSLSWSQLEIPHFLSFVVIIFTHSISLPKKNTSFSFQKTRSSFEKHLLSSFLQHVESLPKLSPSLFSHNLLSPLENQPRSLPKKFFFFYLIPNQIIT